MFKALEQTGGNWLTITIFVVSNVATFIATVVLKTVIANRDSNLQEMKFIVTELKDQVDTLKIDVKKHKEDEEACLIRQQQLIREIQDIKLKIGYDS